MNTDFQHSDQLIAEFDHHDDAARAITDLGKAQIPVKNMSIIGKDYHTEEHAIGYINTGERMVAWGKLGAFWGTVWGVLFGSAVVLVPGVGAVVFGGWIVGTLVAALEGAALGGGLGALGAALSTAGVPKDSIVEYESAIKAGKFIVMVRGTTEELSLARQVLEGLGAKGMKVCDHKVPATV